MKTKIVIIGMIAAMLRVSSAAGAGENCEEPIETTAGKVRGTTETETATCGWRGIPFAAPPVGDLRFRSPEPYPPWDGVRQASEFGDRCMQKGIMDRENPDATESEDCLYLNVWRPAKSGRFPVMFWIHGGGYTGGSANGYRGDLLAESGDVVVVTINYRLNVFGFLPHPALRDNDPNRATGGQGSLEEGGVRA